MEHNPYSPPTTPVADIRGDSAVDNRQVLIACNLFWISFGISLVGTASDLVRRSAIPLLIGAAIGLAFNMWIISKLKAGRNWMRLLITILTALGYLGVAVFWNVYTTRIFPIYAGNPILGVASVLQILVNTWATVLLNLPQSRAWFSQKR